MLRSPPKQSPLKLKKREKRPRDGGASLTSLELGDDTAHCMGSVMTHRDGNFILGIHRGMTAAPFSETETAALQPIVPHLRRLLAVKAQLHMAKARASTANGLLDTLPQGVLVVDHAGRLLFANQLGESLLGPGGPLTLRGDGVRAREHSYDLVLTDLVLSAGLGVRGRGGALSIASTDGPSWRVVVAPWRTGERVRQTSKGMPSNGFVAYGCRGTRR